MSQKLIEKNSNLFSNFPFIIFIEKDIGSQRVLAFQMLEKGVNYDFNLSIVWHQEKGGCHLRIRRVQTSEKHKEREVHFPLWALPQMRQQMATILEEYDGTERIDEMPTIPEWATQGFLIFNI
jgi:hypothetical protein